MLITAHVYTKPGIVHAQSIVNQLQNETYRNVNVDQSPALNFQAS